MSEFLLRRENSPGLKKWVHIEELALHNNNQIRVNSFNDTCPGYLRFYYVPSYPAAFVIKQTRQKPGAEETYLQSASHYWLNLYLNSQRSGSKNSRGNGVTFSRRILFLPGINYFFQYGRMPD